MTSHISLYPDDNIVTLTPVGKGDNNFSRATCSLYDSDNVVADIQGGTVTTQYVTPFLDQNLSMTRGGATYYYSQDGLGSVRTLTDSSGNIANNYDYSAFGSPYAPGTSVSVEQRYTYTGRELNATSGSMYYRWRSAYILLTI